MKVRYDLLNKLADFLDTLPRSHFDLSIVQGRVPATKENTCGTVGCAIGWCPTVFPRLCRAPSASIYGLWAVNGRKINMWSGGHAEVGRRLFGISNDDAYALFTPGEPLPDGEGATLGSTATPKQVAKRIRTYIAWRKKR